MLVPRAKPKLGEDSQHSPVKRLGISQPVGVAEQQGQVVEVLRPIATSGLCRGFLGQRRGARRLEGILRVVAAAVS